MKTYAEYRKQVEEALSGQLRSLGEIPDILLTAIRERRCRFPVRWK